MESEKINWTKTILILIAVLAFADLIYHIHSLSLKIKEITLDNEVKISQARIDSTETEKTSISEKIIINSDENASKADRLAKSLKNEKPVISDTTHAYMYEYVKNYRPE